MKLSNKDFKCKGCGYETNSLDNLMPSGYGHYSVTITFRGKQYSCVTSNMPAVDDYKSEDGERDGRELRRKRGYLALRNEVIRKNDLK